MKPLAFRVRLALLSSGISGIVLLAFGGLAGYLLHGERVAALDREMRALAFRHPGWMGGRGNYERLASTIEFVFGEDRREQLLLWVTDTAGQERYRSPHWPADLTLTAADLDLADEPRASAVGRPGRRGPPWAGGAVAGAPSGVAKAPRFSTVRAGGSTWRLGVMGDGESRLVLGLDCAEMHREMARARNVFLASLPVVLFVIAAGGWWLAGRALFPLRGITRLAEGMTARGLDQRISPSTEDPEISRLIGVLNGMMDRLETSFRQASRFSADASHELKTPLAVMQGEIEGALQTAAPGSPEQQTLASLLEQIQRLKTITRSLLLLARSDAGPLPVTREPLDLAPALRGVVEDFEVAASEHRLRLDFRAPAALPVSADWPLLRQAVSNLLHNAIQYSEAGGTVQVALERRNGTAVIEVVNGGPGIPGAEQPRVFDRFFRGDAVRHRGVEGSGLGLSLAREIVRAHGGILELVESRPGHTRFRLTLPGTASNPSPP